MSVLPDHRIHALCTHEGYPVQTGCLGKNDLPPQLVDPYHRDQLQPASYDVRLGSSFRVFPLSGIRVVDLNVPESLEGLTEPLEIDDDGEFVLHPGELCLATTQEVVTIPDNMVARIEGKSSLGRIGMTAHITAGFIDPGYHGTVTLEMANLMRNTPIVLHPGNLVAQLSFQWMESKAERPYEGRYQGDKTVAPSRYGTRKGD